MSESKPDTKFTDWVILELLGHRRLAGYLTEQTIAGAAFLRLDIPTATDDAGYLTTQFYGPASVYCITPTTEAIARAVAASNPPQAVHLLGLPQFLTGEPAELDADDLEIDDALEDIDLDDEDADEFEDWA